MVATEPGAVWVETVRRSTCSSCSANAGCGQGLMQRLGVGAGRARVRALSDLSLRVGDAVVLGIHEDLLLRASVLFYLFPLLGFFVAALLATRAGLVEPLIIVSGLAGLLAAGAFLVMQRLFGLYLAHFPSYTLVYGAFAVVPIFLLWLYLSWIIILLGADSAITPCELASLIEAACFYPDEDCDADSYHTQQAAFDMQARFTANMLLLGEDAAVLERVREAIREHVAWLIPKDRAIRMQAVNYLVEASFADNDDEAALSAAE